MSDNIPLSRTPLVEFLKEADLEALTQDQYAALTPEKRRRYIGGVGRTLSAREKKFAKDGDYPLTMLTGIFKGYENKEQVTPKQYSSTMNLYCALVGMNGIRHHSLSRNRDSAMDWYGSKDPS